MPHSTQPRLGVVLGTALFGDKSDPQAKINTIDGATSLLEAFRSRGYYQLDTARAYPVNARGTSEKLLGSLQVGSWATVDSKVTSHFAGAHQEEKIAISVRDSLEALHIPKLGVEYLHAPDLATPFEETCRAMDKAYRGNKFERFGISNYSAAEVEQIVAICEENDFVRPTVYQGHYNAIARLSEDELFPVLRKHGISFYAYSPSAAGFFSGQVTKEAGERSGSRWDAQTILGRRYAQDYFKDELFRAAAIIHEAAQDFGLGGHAVALRWAIYHSKLSADEGDAVVIGASSVTQLGQNLDTVESGPLPGGLVKVVEDVWAHVKEHAPHNHR